MCVNRGQEGGTKHDLQSSELVARIVLVARRITFLFVVLKYTRIISDSM
jgi:hypothetical protein